MRMTCAWTSCCTRPRPTVPPELAAAPPPPPPRSRSGIFRRGAAAAVVAATAALRISRGGGWEAVGPHLKDGRSGLPS
jgi:hypothetical protein